MRFAPGKPGTCLRRPAGQVHLKRLVHWHQPVLIRCMHAHTWIDTRALYVVRTFTTTFTTHLHPPPSHTHLHHTPSPHTFTTHLHHHLHHTRIKQVVAFCCVARRFDPSCGREPLCPNPGGWTLAHTLVPPRGGESDGSAPCCGMSG